MALVLTGGSLTEALASTSSRSAATFSERSTDRSDLQEVVAEGAGTTAEAARKDALRAAVAQVVGMLVVAQDLVQNDALIESKVLTYSDGYVESYEPVGGAVQRDGLVRVKVRAKVRQGKLTQVLTSNRIRVREVDLRSIQAQSETQDTRSRSAAEIAAEAFAGFPAALLEVEPQKERRVSGDAEESLVEFPVLVQVDDQKWNAWFQRVRRLLDPIAQDRGAENWNARRAGWHSLRASSAKPRSGPGVSADQERKLWSMASAYWTCRFLPDAFRKDARAYVDGAQEGSIAPAVLSQRKRVIVVLDSMGGKAWWWQLPQEAYDAALSTIGVPTIDVRLENAGQAIGSIVTDWSEVVRSDRPGEPDRTMIERGSLGESRLRVSNSYHGDYAHFDCVTPSRHGRAEGVLLHPCGSMKLDGLGDHLILAPSMVFPYRFRVSSAEVPTATSAALKFSVGQEPAGRDR